MSDHDHVCGAFADPPYFCHPDSPCRRREKPPVSDVDRAIRERLDKTHEDWCDCRDPLMAEDARECNCGMRQLARALRAVLDRHQPHPDSDGDGPFCAEDDKRWPCPTARDIARALDVGGGA